VGAKAGCYPSLITQRTFQTLSALALVAGAVAAASQGWWPFDTTPPALNARPSFWQLLLADRLTLGFVRLGVVMLAVFVIASVPALVAGGRWLKGLGTSGLTADDAVGATTALVELKEELTRTAKDLETLKRQRDAAFAEAARSPESHETKG
jgi:hypothetical protein